MLSLIARPFDSAPFRDSGTLSTWPVVSLMQVEEALRDINFKDGNTCLRSLFQELTFRDFLDAMMLIGIMVRGIADACILGLGLG